MYEEENSGMRDSVYVTSAAENPSNYDFDVEVYSTHQNYYYRYWPIKVNSSQCPSNGKICGRCIQVKRSKYKPGDFVNESTCFLFIPLVGDGQYVFNTELENNRIFVDGISDSSEFVSGMVFDRTVKIRELNTYMEGAQSTNHYFSENVGLIKKELLDSNQVWNLINYHIEQ